MALHSKSKSDKLQCYKYFTCMNKLSTYFKIVILCTNAVKPDGNNLLRKKCIEL